MLIVNKYKQLYIKSLIASMWTLNRLCAVQFSLVILFFVSHRGLGGEWEVVTPYILYGTDVPLE